MASQPPPESIIVGQFAGVKNTVSRERLQQGELETAINVDIDDAGQIRRRRGVTLREGSRYHSARTLAGRTFVVRSGVLGTLARDFSFTPIADVGPDYLCYTSVGETVYYASRVTSGKIVDGQARAWGMAASPGEWLSPVMRPTETLGAVAGKLLGAPPLATDIEAYKGRIYLAHKNVLWATELYLYDKVDKTKGFLQFEHDITMVRAVETGLFVGTEAQTFFLQGTWSTGLKRLIVVDSPTVRGSPATALAADVHPNAKSGNVPEGNAILFMTGEGICAGFDDGQVFNLTRGRMVFPSAVSAAALYRADQGANAYVAVADSAGGPSANARIGDYVDAEIVRASQRGL